jgi:hypothetical protein
MATMATTPSGKLRGLYQQWLLVADDSNSQSNSNHNRAPTVDELPERRVNQEASYPPKEWDEGQTKQSCKVGEEPKSWGSILRLATNDDPILTILTMQRCSLEVLSRTRRRIRSSQPI